MHASAALIPQNHLLDSLKIEFYILLAWGFRHGGPKITVGRWGRLTGGQVSTGAGIWK
jgi:hypothetical protein